MKFQCKPQPDCLQKNSQCILFICTEEGRKIKGEREGETAVNVMALQIGGVRHSGPLEWKKIYWAGCCMGFCLYLLVLASRAFRASYLSHAAVLPASPTQYIPSTFSGDLLLPPRLSLGMGGGSFRNSPKLTSLKSLPHQHDSPQKSHWSAEITGWHAAQTRLTGFSCCLPISLFYLPIIPCLMPWALWGRDCLLLLLEQKALGWGTPKCWCPACHNKSK